jgi:CBS domain-containing protein
MKFYGGQNMQTIREVMTTNVDFCTPLDNVFEVATKMKDLDVGAIPIVENNELLGMITDRDLVVRGIAEKHPGSNSVTNIMSDHLITIGPDASIEEAAHKMAEHQIRRLPVVENGALIGIVSLGDLAIHDYSDDQAGEALSEISEE